ncbi:MAG: A/G-specific adenine glycosylase [Pseudomonadota bacterium]|nr:A/G-specific adenine glycosylase [Pseudomonadota bacterium]
MRKQLLNWYDFFGRDLPWRAPSGASPDPYRVWLSEIMLQQTTVATAGPYFENFITRWPNLRSLADASLDEVLHSWQGLGYYARARNLHRCATLLKDQYDCKFPQSETMLLSLPGIGQYTAAAILAIAFNKPANVVDGNVERVVARLFEIEDPLPPSKNKLRHSAEQLVPSKSEGRPGDYAQALMDLGAMICLPRKPKCDKCPWAPSCRSAQSGQAQFLPRREPKKIKPVRYGIVYWIQTEDEEVLIRRRPEKGLLGGMMEFPSTEWVEEKEQTEMTIAGIPIGNRAAKVEGIISHTFTHFKLELSLSVVRLPRRIELEDLIWCSPKHFGEHAFSSLMKKVAQHAMRYLE